MQRKNENVGCCRFLLVLFGLITVTQYFDSFSNGTAGSHNGWSSKKMKI